MSRRRQRAAVALPACAALLLAAVPALTAQAQSAAADAPAARPDERAGGWIGKVVPPYPEGIIQRQGTCIGSGGLETICRHMVDVLHDPQSGLRTVAVVEEVPHFGRQSLGRIVDAMVPAELDDPALEVAVGICQVAGADDVRVLAIVAPVAATQWLPARRAWRVDPAGTLMPLATAGVRCRNEGFGYDG